jgi:ABC-type dipeptide/oligopeptide/nickel transport system permease component
MLRYIVRRLLAIPFLILGVATLAFILGHGIKGDPLASLLSERQMGNAEVVAAVKARWGLDKSLPEQYAAYIINLLKGDLGTSFRTKRPVLEDILERLPATLELVTAAMIFGSLFGITLGIIAAYYKNRRIDDFSRLFALIGSSMPIFWSGLIMLFIFSVKLRILPGPGRLDPSTELPLFVTGMFTLDALIAGDFKKFLEALSHLILPACILGWAVMGIISRIVRASMLDVLNQEYILTARAKGAREPRVVVNHALRNVMIPTLTIIGFSFAYLITGAVLTETIFAWPGVGSYAVGSARSLDYPAIIGVTIVGAAAFLFTNLVTDISYAVANPKIRLG